MIDHYQFGQMIVNGETFTNDLKLFPEGIKDNWWRDEGHLLQRDDLDDVFEYRPDVLVIGQGANGRMRISDDLKERFDDADFEVIAAPTADAVDAYNERADDNVIGVFHLTC
jgi:hypothetical protein